MVQADLPISVRSEISMAFQELSLCDMSFSEIRPNVLVLLIRELVLLLETRVRYVRISDSDQSQRPLHAPI